MEDPSSLQLLWFVLLGALLTSYAILGYSGGAAKALADVAIHFPVDDMQIAEDTQLVVGHMLMQWLYEHRDAVE